ncbi:hypothetical protein BC937DRAFT_91968 [Endogone sp. FLAS-F59071]|nr:hypothetical protein BC937DRAFT_91968 [Endogone sp. FLAS-F59071]|eukprot:RUS15815.1 hypothetical protein BC937DRAFT_91968 [Endogone sp. FLAS-F59071]
MQYPEDPLSVKPCGNLGTSTEMVLTTWSSYALAADQQTNGLARHAMRIYDRTTKSVADKDWLEMFNLYIAKASATFVITSTREIYERAIKVLPDREAKEMCRADRARAVYAHASQFCNPRVPVEDAKVERLRFGIRGSGWVRIRKMWNLYVFQIELAIHLHPRRTPTTDTDRVAWPQIYMSTLVFGQT